MTSERQRQANRANGRASAGPKTVAGKARVRFNALRHGLSTRVLEDDRWGPDVEPLARRLAGENANADLLAMAREVAEQQIELMRVHAYRERLIERVYSDPDFRTKRHQASDPRVDANIADGSTAAALGERILPHDDSATDPSKCAEVLTSMARDLAGIDRYEQRALSRRKFAIRALDELRAKTLIDGSTRDTV
jgi:hypothetical protein